MDWKDHIIASDNYHPQAQVFSVYANESFLVTLANKGLYKRALKDLESTQHIELKGDSPLQVQLDDITVTLNENVSQSTCTCPSKTICKHVLMAILVTAGYSAEIPSETSQENMAKNSTKDEKQAHEEPWKSLKEVDIAALRKQAGKKLFEDTLRLIQDGWTADFKESEMLEATINTENIIVYFPSQDSINRSVCKCGEQGLCKHKLIAILSYLSDQGLLNNNSEDTTTLSLLNDESRAILEAAGKFVIHIFDKGIINCGENESETAIQFSIRLETCGIGNLSRLFRSLSSDLENMLSKHVGFNQITTFSTLSRLHNTIQLILRNLHDNQKLGLLIESTRSDYYTTPLGNFTGLGAFPWQTRSGYFGITAYFFYHEKQVICTFTTSLAGYYEQTEELATIDNLSRQFTKNTHWADSHSLAVLSQSTFTLRNFKLNKQYRLSSSAQTQCEITGKVDRGTLQNLQSIRQLFELTEFSEESYQYFSKRPPDQIILVPFQKLSDVYFSHTKQKLLFNIEQIDETSIKASLDFNPFTKNAIKYLERIGDFPDNKSHYMVFLKRKDGLIPVSIVDDNGMNNFFFKQ